MFDNFKNFMDPQQYMNNAKQFANFDMNSFNKSFTKNAQNMSELSKCAMDNTQVFAKKNAEIMQRNASNVFNAMKDLTSNQSSENSMSQTQNYVKNAFETVTQDGRELAELATKSSIDFMNLASSKFNETVNEYFQTAKDVQKQAV